MTENQRELIAAAGVVLFHVVFVLGCLAIRVMINNL